MADLKEESLLNTGIQLHGIAYSGQDTTAKPSSATCSFNVAIVGGGIAGLCTAIAIKNKRPDTQVTVFEGARQFAEIGAGMGFAPNSARALALMGLGEAFANTADQGFYTYNEEYRFVLPEYRNGFTAEHLYTNPSPGYTSVHRARMLDMLVRELPKDIKVHFGKRAVSVTQTADKATVTFDEIAPDGSKTGQMVFEADAVIGCDGAKSKIREGCYPDAVNECFRYTGTYAYRTVLKMEDVIRLNGPHLATVPHVWIGKGRHILTYPVEQGRLMNVVAGVSDRSKPRDQRVWDGPPSWLRQVDSATALKDFEGMSQPVLNIMGLIQNPTQWAVHEVGPLDQWAFGRVLLIGDSAHSMAPFAGSGASQAVEDAVVLSTLMGQPQCTAENLPEILAATEKFRVPRAKRVQDISYDIGELYQLEHKGFSDPYAVTQQMPGRWDFIYRHDIQHDIDDALTYLRERGVFKTEVQPQMTNGVSTKRFKILAISGSLRAASMNTKLLHAAAKLVPAGCDYEILDWSKVPIFCEDLETEELMPKAVLEVREKADAADAIVFATPEYNHSIPGPLKNLIDWLSRSYTPTGKFSIGANKVLPLTNKAAVIIGISPFIGGSATIRGQTALRGALVYPNMRVLNEPTVALSGGKALFKEDEQKIPLLELKDDSVPQKQVARALLEVVKYAKLLGRNQRQIVI